MSAGQTTRVILAKSFVNYPRLILLDEPTASLDPESAETVRKFLVRQQKKYKVAMLFTSHNMAEVAEVCDRVIFINHGKITAEDTPERLAKTITDCKLKLTIPGLEKVNQDQLANLGSSVEMTKDQLSMVLPEVAISQVLQKLSRAGIEYSQITIDKPTLEDYFLAKSREKI